MMINVILEGSNGQTTDVTADDLFCVDRNARKTTKSNDTYLSNLIQQMWVEH